MRNPGGSRRRRDAAAVIALCFTAVACGGKTDDAPSRLTGTSMGGGASVTETTLTTPSTSSGLGGSSTAPASSSGFQAQGGSVGSGGTHASSTSATGGVTSTLCVPSTPIVVFGNGKLEPPEDCDDGNRDSGDGCTDGCGIEVGYYCPVPGKPCLLRVAEPASCGNAVVDRNLGESCDDGAQNGLPGSCDANCGRVAVCGNAIVELSAGEQCDDGLNDGSYGGCTADCQRAAYCGDEVKNGDEQCDLGDSNSRINGPAYGDCLANCLLGPHCGDGLVQKPFEECDLGSCNGPNSYLDYCSLDCRIPIIDIL